MTTTRVRPTRAALPTFRHPSRAVVVGFAAAIALGTLLLLLPISRAGGDNAPFMVALLTATSAVCVTGLVVVDTPTYWSGFGEAVILGLIQLGGLGIMTAASLLVLLVSRRMGLRSRLTAGMETKSLGIGDVRAVLVGVLKVTIAFETVIAVVLSVRFSTEYGETWAARSTTASSARCRRSTTQGSRSTPTASCASSATHGSACRSRSR